MWRRLGYEPLSLGQPHIGDLERWDTLVPVLFFLHHGLCEGPVHRAKGVHDPWTQA